MQGPIAEAWRQQQRANEKVKRARQMMPFLRKLVKAASEIAMDFDREEVLLDLEAIKDCVMAEAERDPELNDDQKIMISNLVSGLAKNWTRMEGYVYGAESNQTEQLISLGFVMVAFLDIMYHRYKVHAWITDEGPPELKELIHAMGLEPPENGP